VGKNVSANSHKFFHRPSRSIEVSKVVESSELVEGSESAEDS